MDNLNKNVCESYFKNPSLNAFFKERGKLKGSKLILKNLILEFEFAYRV